MRSLAWLAVSVLAGARVGEACTCGGGEPLCKYLARPEAKLDGWPDHAMFVGKVVFASPREFREIDQREADYAARHPEARAQPGARSKLTLEGFKGFLLELWAGNESAETRSRILALKDGGTAGKEFTPPLLTRFEIVEAFTSGLKKGDAIDLTDGLSMCSILFPAGATYLVSAYRTDAGFWSTSACSLTNEVARARQELEALRAWRDRKPLPRLVYGWAYDSTLRPGGFQTLTNFPLRLLGGPAPRETVTDSEGRFEFPNLDPGTYRIEPVQPYWSLRSYRRLERIEIVNGCEEVNASFEERLATIRGRVQAVDGQAVAAAPVSLLPADPRKVTRRPVSGRFDAEGNLVAKGMEPGEYILALNPSGILRPPPPDTDRPSAREEGMAYPASFYPGRSSRGEAGIIRVVRGTDVVLPAAWALPAALAVRRVEAVVLTPDGGPALHARAWVKDAETNATVNRGGPALADGLIYFHVFEGRSYRVEVAAHDTRTGFYGFGIAQVGAGQSGRITIRLEVDGRQPRDPTLFTSPVWTRHY